jgi:hypothetical protein
MEKVGMSPVLPRRSFLKSFRYSSNLSIHLPNMWSAAMVRIPWPDKLLRKARSTTVRFASVGLGGGFHILSLRTPPAALSVACGASAGASGGKAGPTLGSSGLFIPLRRRCCSYVRQGHGPVKPLHKKPLILSGHDYLVGDPGPSGPSRWGNSRRRELRLYGVLGSSA